MPVNGRRTRGGAREAPSGQTLVEAVIAMLLVAMVAAGLFGSLLSSERGTAVSERKEDLSMCAAQVLQALKSYVTGDPVAPAANAPGDPSSIPGLNTWHLPGDTCLNQDSTPPSCGPAQPAALASGQPSCWALAPGDHDAGSLLSLCSPALSRPPYNAILTYHVTLQCVDNGAENLDTRKVDVKVDWSEPRI